ncbi:putative zinc-binding protein [Asinibacterium sp. OR53]|uniref:putative zinc-binding protein n=1 Tax=Asinibacterium sp. OR53 TaxID=925409 RepID=UPI00068657BE|nr:putative zinc-binding protein [Asinibacterium sp. OR53]
MKNTTEIEEIPLVYSCSGCSSAAQMANYLALRLDRNGLAEMSCIAGVGGNVKSLVRKALSGRKIVAIDGCPLACVRACLGNHGVVPSLHVQLWDHGVKKQNHIDFDPNEADRLLSGIERSVRKLQRKEQYDTKKVS